MQKPVPKGTHQQPKLPTILWFTQLWSGSHGQIYIDLNRYLLIQQQVTTVTLTVVVSGVTYDKVCVEPCPVSGGDGDFENICHRLVRSKSGARTGLTWLVKTELFSLRWWNYHFPGPSNLPSPSPVTLRHNISFFSSRKVDNFFLEVIIQRCKSQVLRRNSGASLDLGYTGWKSSKMMSVTGGVFITSNEVWLSIDRHCQCPSFEGELSRTLHYEPFRFANYYLVAD